MVCRSMVDKDDESADHAVELYVGFSFAYLKENVKGGRRAG